MGGCAKLMMVFMLLNAVILILFVASGVVVYLNWEKFGPSLIEKAEDKLVSLPIVEAVAKQLGFASMTELLEKMEESLAEMEGGFEEGGASGGPVRRPYVASTPFMVNAITYEKYANRKDVLVLVDYYAKWFEPSKKQLPSLVRLAKQHGNKVIVLRVNLDQDKNFANRQGVRLNSTKEHYLQMKDEAQTNSDSKLTLENVEKYMGIPDLRILHGGRQLRRMERLQTYQTLESAVLSLEQALPRPKRPPTLKAQSPGDSVPAAGSGGLPPGMLRGGKKQK